MGPAGQPLDTKTCHIWIILYQWYRFFFLSLPFNFLTCYGRGTLQDVGPICHTLILRCSLLKNTKLECWMRIRTQDLHLLGRICMKRCPANAPTWYLRIIQPSIDIIYTCFPITSVKHRCCWWVPMVSLSVKIEGRYRMWVQYVILSYYAIDLKNTKRHYLSTCFLL